MVALAAIVGLGVSGTLSTLTATTANRGNTFAAGTVAIDADGSGGAAFAIDGLRPGDAATRCINVVNAGTLPFSNVALSGAAGGGLAGHLTVTVDRGSGAAGGASASCGGFTPLADGIVGGRLSDFPTLADPVDDGAGWAPGARKSYRFVVTLPATAGNEAQGRAATLEIRWDASS